MSKRLADLLSDSKGEALNSPVVRMALGLPVGAPGSRSEAAPRAPSVVQKQAAAVAPSKSIQDAIIKRFKFVDEVGYVRPGPGMLSGAKLRPEVQKWGEEYGGGIVAIDMTDITPAEVNALRYMIDPKWFEQGNGG